MSAYGNDCQLFYDTSSGCEKGDRCPFRHSEPARSSFVTCNFWQKGRCTKSNCKFRHSVVKQQQKNRQLIPCWHETQPSGCTRPGCPFKHSKHDPVNQYGYKEILSATAVASVETGSDFYEPSRSPSVPISISCTSNSIMLSWTELEEDSGYTNGYKIVYRECNLGDSRWKSIITESKRTIYTVKDLKGDTQYEFKICSIDRDGKDGYFSNPAVAFITKSSLSHSVKGLAKRIRRSDPEIYKIPFQKTKGGTNNAAKTQKCYFGQKRPGTSGKTIMLVGATGSGKSTLLDGMINYIFDVSWDDEFRFTVVEMSDEEKTRYHDQTQSQTEWITSYTIRTMSGSNIDYDLHIVDTPGFGDTRGVVRDKEIVDQIRQFFTTKGSQGIMYLDAICFVIQAPLVRLTPPQRYLFDAILSIFGQDVVNNIYVLITFADGKQPPVIDALQGAKVPFKHFYTFNNSALFSSRQISQESEFASLYWKMGRESFSVFFEELRFTQTKSLQLTKQVLQLRQNIEATVQGLQPQIHEGLHKLNTIEQEKEILRRHEREIEANKNFMYEVDEIHMRKIDLSAGTYVTNCLTCNRTCHFPCRIPEDRNKMHCAAMNDGHCTVCPEKCFWDIHRNNDFRFETYSVKVKSSYEELKRKYLLARIGKERQTSVVDSVKLAFKQLYKKVQKMMNDVRCYINKLNEIALRPNPLSDVDYIDLLIQSEKNEKKYGWQKRINFFVDMREEAEIITKIARKETFHPFGKLHNY
ncbi:uncharacterized protein [Mytilus edulis]|uniref:uncharacterized protein isoform X1 n=1 Tax=Mytilus edulis TaxID=6550 RepID=UPI0039EF7966